MDDKNRRKYLTELEYNESDEDYGGDQHYKARLTQAQKEQEAAEKELRQSYDGKTSEKKKSSTKSETNYAEEAIREEDQKDSPKKNRQKLSFITFVKRVWKTLAWKKIVSQLRALFRSKKELREVIIGTTSLTKARSHLQSKSEKKELESRLIQSLLLKEMLREANQAMKESLLQVQRDISRISEAVKAISVAEEIKKDINQRNLESKVSQKHSAIFQTTIKAEDWQRNVSTVVDKSLEGKSLPFLGLSTSVKPIPLLHMMNQTTDFALLNAANIGVRVVTAIGRNIIEVGRKATHFIASEIKGVNFQMLSLQPARITVIEGKSLAIAEDRRAGIVNMKEESLGFAIFYHHQSTTSSYYNMGRARSIALVTNSIVLTTEKPGNKIKSCKITHTKQGEVEQITTKMF